MKRIIHYSLIIVLLTGCHPRSTVLEPEIIYFPTERQFRMLPSDFPELTTQELSEDWGKELKIAIQFARELDLYRAITSYKRALFLMPQDRNERVWQIEYSIMLCYYLGMKYEAAIEAFENSHLTKAPTSFPAFRDLVMIVYDSYRKVGKDEKAEAVFQLLEKGNPSTARNIELYEAIEEANFAKICTFTEEYPAVENFLNCYNCQAKSVRKAQALNAILPGAGYLYVGQKNTAVTSFLINASFIAASWYFFDHKNYGAGVIFSSLEVGWYIGGINGAGLAAKEWNQYVYDNNGKELLIELGIFPVLMLGASF